MAKKAKYQDLALVLWVDASEDEAGWKEDTDPELGLVHCESVGFLTRKTKQQINLRADQTDDGGVGRRTTIPRGWGQEIIILARKDEDGNFFICCPECGMQAIGKGDE